MPALPDPLKSYRLYFAMFILNLAIVAGVIYLMYREPARPVVVTVPPTRSARVESPGARIRVTVSGAVNAPGALQLGSDARLAEALQQAGVTSDADLSKLDLMRPLQDGDKIHVPAKKQVAANENPTALATAARVSVVNTVPATTAQPEGKLNLNTATLEELDALPGIGTALAQRILDYRAQKGGFKTIEELKEVKGIGDKLFDDIKELITVQ